MPVLQYGRAADAGEPASRGVIEVPVLRRLQLALHDCHPARKVLMLCGE